jgi:hypothetical protein
MLLDLSTLDQGSTMIVDKNWRAAAGRDGEEVGPERRVRLVQLGGRDALVRVDQHAHQAGCCTAVPGGE